MRLITRSAFITRTAKYLSTAAILAAATESHAQLDPRTSTEATGIRFKDFLEQVNAASDSSSRSKTVGDYIAKLQTYGKPVVEDSTVHFLFLGKAKKVSVTGDLNSWNPSKDTMERVPKTNLFYLSIKVPRAARFEYKLVVDSTWIPDPLNQQKVMGGYGANSEIWMPLYRPPVEIEYRPEIRHGRIETVIVQSSILRRAHPIFVYLPPSYKKSGKKSFPSMFVMDGGEYITLARMTNVLDNLIAEKRIEPVVGVFVDPRTDIRDVTTSQRMVDYTMSDTFVRFLVDEVRTVFSRKYRISSEAARTGIMGASLGGLISTYAAFTKPDAFGLCAAQSPSYWWKKDSMITLVRNSPKRAVKFYISTGTIRDAQEEASAMHKILTAKGYNVLYEECPEGHNWANWRARLATLLEYFWRRK